MIPPMFNKPKRRRRTKQQKIERLRLQIGSWGHEEMILRKKAEKIEEQLQDLQAKILNALMELGELDPPDQEVP